MSSSSNHRHRWSRSSVNEDPRREMTRRSSYQSSLQIRKRRKEELLLVKRGRQTTTTSAGDLVTTVERSPLLPTNGVVFQQQLEQFLRTNPPSVVLLEPLTRVEAVPFLQRLVVVEQQQEALHDQHTSSSTCDRLLDHLRTLIMLSSSNGNEEEEEVARTMVVKLIESLVSTKTQEPTTNDNGTTNDNYYGATRPVNSWSELLMSRLHHQEWISLLVSLLSKYPTVISSILSHLFHDSSTAAQSWLIPQYWPVIIATLPHAGTAQLCAVILQEDCVTFGMQFMYPHGGLTSTHLVGLLNDPVTAVSAAWMLEGLTRREDQVVEYLCRDPNLVQTLLRQLHATSATTTTTNPALLLLPTLRTIGNMITACQGQFLSLFVETLRDALCHLLQQPYHVPMPTVIVEEVLWVMGCCLMDAGRPHHVATTTFCPLWIPHVVSALLDQSSSSSSSSSFVSTFDVKRRALATLWITLSMPPNVTLQERDEIQVQLDSILVQYVWNNSHLQQQYDYDADAGSTMLVDSLSHLLTVDHNETVITVLRILQRLVDVVPSSHNVLRSRDVLDRLHAVCSEEDRNKDQPSLAHDLAMNLIESLQGEDDDDEDEVDMNHRDDDITNTLMNPSIVDGGFSFGLLPVAMQETTAALASATHSSVPLMGRGRGRTVPAWVEQQQPKQHSF